MWSKLLALPDGAYPGTYLEKSYLITKQITGRGKILKFFARETGGRDFVSANGYRVHGEWVLKPCEMHAQKVWEFVAGVKI